MTTAIHLIAIATLAAAAAYVATEAAIAVARRTDFLDRPHDATYKAHARPTPYLGGAAVLLAFSVGALASDAVSGRLLVLLVCAAGLAVLGALDDRFTVAPRWRIAAELLAAFVLWSSHLGFTVSSSSAVNLSLTALWVVGVVNAFNLSDNMDGACASLTAVSALGIACWALVGDDVAVAAVAVALAAACAGFLPHNLAGPARIFLGDGGSMPLGFLVAGLALALARGRGLALGELLACGLIAGLPLLDTVLVSVSRTRRGLTILTGGRDHLTHRLHARLGSPRRVALALVLIQAGLATLAVAGVQVGHTLLLGLGLTTIAAGMLAVAVLDSRAWRPHELASVAVPAAPVEALGTRQRVPARAAAAPALAAAAPALAAPGHADMLAAQPRITASRVEATHDAHDVRAVA